MILLNNDNCVRISLALISTVLQDFGGRLVVLLLWVVPDKEDEAQPSEDPKRKASKAVLRPSRIFKI